MEVTKNKMTITLDSEQDIKDFWNIVAFALDYDNANGNTCFNDRERKMAKELVKLTASNDHIAHMYDDEGEDNEAE